MTIFELLRAGATDDIALSAPDRPDATFGALRDHVERTVAALNKRGIGREDRVAIVLPNGPEMASAFLSVAAGATTAPLNPRYTERECAFYLADLRAEALLLREGDASPARRAAFKLGIPVLDIRFRPTSPAGLFSFAAPASEPRAPPKRSGPADPADTALVLHTSGTTSRPKIVPLLHRNLCASARNIGRTLALGPDDRCLNILPLFHIHGLAACILATLGSGGSVNCTPGFNALKVFAWIRDSGATWYSAVPAMHRAMLVRATRSKGSAESVKRVGLRFIRSSSAPLRKRLLTDLETTFGAPVVEAYAMTEAAHQMTSNPLPHVRRKLGSVGPAAGPEVAIADADGNHLGPGEEGEIVVRGANVMSGYERNAAANAAAFTTDGWFRTGDLGYCDDEGYFTVTGRLKEIINRGGEKVSPHEVDAVLLDHPAVQQAVAFAVPHAALGEEVAAAVVLHRAEGDAAGTGEPDSGSIAAIRAFAAGRLAPFKVPRTIVVVDEIPKGPTGKPRRLELPAQLGLAPAASPTDPDASS